ncbi:hypothetical protein M885DRAFT_524420 [Pelagophyceae sp. CCMP2097]|nr:hypothetical protein M885DRAFT_524420 [Pelagophyceae sp. CCMP2097]
MRREAGDAARPGGKPAEKGKRARGAVARPAPAGGPRETNGGPAPAGPRSRDVEDDSDEDDIETIYCVVELPKGVKAPNFYFNQLAGLDTAAPTVSLGGRKMAGRVEKMRGTTFVFEKRLGTTVGASPDGGASQSAYAFHSKPTKLIRFS